MLISVIVETFTVSHEYPATASIEESPLQTVLEKLHGQTYPADQTEIILMTDESELERYQPLQHRFPMIRLAKIQNARYFSMKNYGADLAHGEVIAFLDADCVPNLDWLERIARSINQGAEVVVGKTRYRSDKLLASTFSVFDFGHVQADPRGRANYFNANNLAFKADVIQPNKFDVRVRRNGACYHLWLRLTRQGRCMVYDSDLFASHGYDIEGWGFIPKHYERGFDAVRFIQLDEEGVMPGSRHRWLGIFTPIAMAISRILFDFKRIVSNRKDLGIPWYAIPYFYFVSMIIRAIEMLGGLVAIVRPTYRQ